jgi:hypothetical protein
VAICGKFSGFAGDTGGIVSKGPVVTVVPIATGKPFIAHVAFLRVVTLLSVLTMHGECSGHSQIGPAIQGARSLIPKRAVKQLQWDEACTGL